MEKQRINYLMEMNELLSSFAALLLMMMMAICLPYTFVLFYQVPSVYICVQYGRVGRRQVDK